MYTVYQIECVTPKHRYVGFTGNFLHRIEQHQAGKGAHFTRKHGVKMFTVIKNVPTTEEAKHLEGELFTQGQKEGYVMGGFGKAVSIKHACGCVVCPQHGGLVE